MKPKSSKQGRAVTALMVSAVLALSGCATGPSEPTGLLPQDAYVRGMIALSKGDAATAAQLLKIASTPVSGTTMIYVPSPTGGYGTVNRVRTGPDVPAIPEADLELARLYLEGRGVPRDLKKARHHAEKARNSGVPGAGALLLDIDAAARKDGAG